MELMTLTKQRIADVYALAEKSYGRKFNFPSVDFKIRGRCAGRAFYYQNHISLNLNLLIENGQNFISDTPGHEAAHLIAYQLHGSRISPHGYEWKSVMRVIGQEANRCHDFVVKTDHVYVCNCKSEHYLSTRRHNSVMRGDIKITCNTCKKHIVLKKWAMVMATKDDNIPQPIIQNEKQKIIFAGVSISS